MNTPPGKPISPNQIVMGDTVIFNWGPPANMTGAEADGISYNLYLGTTTGNTDLQSPAG
ncbi:MAG: hypothetical protein R3B93_22320 [Bacteroidia bacterium]